jgi:DNA primase
MQFTDLLDKHGIKYETEGRHCRPGWVQLACPFCGGGSDPTKPYLGYNLARGFSNCWNCGPHSAISLLMKLTGLRASEASKLLDRVDSIRELQEVVRGKLEIPKGVKPMLKAHRKYLRERGFDPNEIEDRWKVQGIGINARLKWRLFIPIQYRGKTVSWTTRSISHNAKTRYISASLTEEAIPHKSLLYGEDRCRHTIIVHEGPLDVWRMGPGAVATMGTGVSAAQVVKMAGYARRIICFDNEPAAQERARELCDSLEVFDGETINVQIDAKDVAEASEKEIRKLRKLVG